MRYYAIADLHGRYDLLLEAINLIYDDAGSDDYKIITLGDYIDRGPQSKEVIEHLMGRTGDTVSLQGNHEAMMVEVCRTPSPSLKAWWEGNGGDTTWKSFGGFNGITIEHYNWVNKLPLYFKTEKQLFVHAGVPQDNMNLPVNSKQSHKEKHLKEQMIWMLYDRNTAGGWKGKHVVHGHHQFADGPHTWTGPKGGRTDLDTYAWRTGRLVIGVFDDTQGPAIKYIEVLADDYKRPT